MIKTLWKNCMPRAQTRSCPLENPSKSEQEAKIITSFACCNYWRRLHNLNMVKLRRRKVHRASKFYLGNISQVYKNKEEKCSKGLKNTMFFRKKK
jgi:hypothetical protein